MAVTSGKIITGTSNYTRFYLSWQKTDENIAENKTYIAWQVGIEATTASATWRSNAIKVYDVYINGNKVSGGGTWSNKTVSPNNPIQLLSGTAEISHNNDGTKTFNANFTAWLYSNFNTSANGDFELPTIPRQTSITSFSVSKRDETSFTFNWSTSDTIDYVWYSTNNGSSWTGYDVADGTSGSFTVSGLSANTSYNCKLRVRRKDSQMTTDSGTVAQTTYAIPTQSLKSKAETSITINWNIDSTANYIWYSTDNGSNWTAVGSVNATSGSYTISGLTANVTYNIKTKIRRASTNTTYENGTSTLSVQTYQYPYVSTVGTSSLTIGKSQTLTLYNPLSRNVSIYMKQNNTSGTQLYSGTTTGTSITFTPNSTTLYNSIPNAKQSNCVYYCTYSNQTVSTKSGTYAIDNSQGQQNPTFSTSNWTYTANYTNLTNNNKVVINGKSTITFNINTAATAKNGASISKYKLEWGSVNKEITTTSGSLSNGSSSSLKVTAIDSRGYTTSTLLDLGNNYVNYFIPTNSEVSTHRESGVGTATTLDLRGTIFNAKFGSSGVQNTIDNAKYYISTDNINWSTDYGILTSSFTYNNNNYVLDDYVIHQNGSSGGFAVGTKFYIKVTITDKLSTSTFYGTITDGKIAVDVYQDSNNEYHRGINGLANSNYNEQINGTLNVTGNIYINGVDLLTYIRNNS